MLFLQINCEMYNEWKINIKKRLKTLSSYCVVILNPFFYINVIKKKNLCGCRVAACEGDGLISEASQDSRVQIHAFRTYGF